CVDDHTEETRTYPVHHCRSTDPHKWNGEIEFLARIGFLSEVLPCFNDHQCQWEGFQCREDTTDSNPVFIQSLPEVMVTHTQSAAQRYQEKFKEHDPNGRLMTNQAYRHGKEGDYPGGKQFKGQFHPKMDYPPTVIVVH